MAKPLCVHTLCHIFVPFFHLSINGVQNPTECMQYHLGEVIPFRYVFIDDEELGSFNIEIHNNFDHYTHSGSSVECEMDAKKEASERAWVFNQSYSIPAGLKRYSARIDIPIHDDAEVGDYHFTIRLTDRAGWQQLKAIAIKIR